MTSESYFPGLPGPKNIDEELAWVTSELQYLGDTIEKIKDRLDAIEGNETE